LYFARVVTSEAAHDELHFENANSRERDTRPQQGCGRRQGYWILFATSLTRRRPMNSGHNSVPLKPMPDDPAALIECAKRKIQK